MKTLFRAGGLSLALSAALSAPTARAQDELDIVASFSILGEMAARVGGEHVAVELLVGPDGDAHVYQPTPSDARALGEADLLLVNGLAFEGWMDRLVESVGYQGPIVVAAAGIDAIRPEEEEGHDHDHAAAGHDHDHGEFDPHAWHDLTIAAAYVDTIVAGLAAADPAHAAEYEANGAAYKAEIAALDGEIRAKLGAVPAERRRVLTAHDAFGYFSRAYRVEFIAPVGVSTDSEASAGDVARIIDQIRSNRVSAIFVENITDPRLIGQISTETGVKIGGTLYSDALSAPGTPAGTFLGLARHNADTIAAAISGS